MCDKSAGEISNLPPQEHVGETGGREPGDGGEVVGCREGCDGASAEGANDKGGGGGGEIKATSTKPYCFCWCCCCSCSW